MPTNDYLSTDKDVLATLLVEMWERHSNNENILVVTNDQFEESTALKEQLRITRSVKGYVISLVGDGT